MTRANPEQQRALLLEELRRSPGKPLSAQEVMSRAHIHPGERTVVKRLLRDLAREGLLLRDGKRFSVPGATKGGAEPEPQPQVPAGRGRLAPSPGALLRPGRRNEVLGTLKKHRDGFGFVARLDRNGDDVFMPPDEAARALDGDLVRVEIVPARGGRTAGRLVEVVERRRRLLIGTYHARGKQSFVIPADAELAEQVPVPETDRAQDGEVVKVALDPASRRLVGEVVEAIGRPGEPRVEVLRVAYARGFADVFPDAVRAEAETVPDHVRPEDRTARRDLTALPLVTIDGEDARDFDDAVYVERLPAKKGSPLYRLVVAIADVAHYVRSGSALDGEASRRATSVYFPMQVLPMLPERLSNGICSLNPEVDRLCMVADLVIGADGQPRHSEVYQAVMRSAARCTYNEVARVLSGERVPGRERFRPEFELMAELQEKLTGMRRERGALDFDLPEAKIVLDEEGHVAAIEKRPRNRAHRIVEEFMLAANEAVARWFGSRSLPTIYRVHGLPDEEKLKAFLDLAAAHGFEVPELPAEPRALNALLTRLAGHAQQRALNQLLLRAMMQAVYTPENIGHYGLAAEHYLHFTSPIRRYPDLMVHRLLKEEWAARLDQPVRRTPALALEEAAALSSERERASMEAEREIASYYAALFMKDKVGETFDGLVSAVLEFGIFVELSRWYVEGLVKVEDLPGDFELDPVHHYLVDRHTKRAFKVGDPVKVLVSAASPIRRQITFDLVEAEAEAEAGGRKHRPARRAGGEQQARPERQAQPERQARPERQAQQERQARQERPERAQPERQARPAQRKPGAQRTQTVRATDQQKGAKKGGRQGKPSSGRGGQGNRRGRKR